MVKKSDHVIKTILKDAVVLLKLNMRSMFQNAELLDRQVLIHFNSIRSKTLHGTRRFLGPIVNLLNISFESKTASEILFKTNIFKKYTFPQQHETNASAPLVRSNLHSFFNEHVRKKAIVLFSLRNILFILQARTSRKELPV